MIFIFLAFLQTSKIEKAFFLFLHIIFLYFLIDYTFNEGRIYEADNQLQLSEILKVIEENQSCDKIWDDFEKKQIEEFKEELKLKYHR